MLNNVTPPGFLVPIILAISGEETAETLAPPYLKCEETPQTMELSQS